MMLNTNSDVKQNKSEIHINFLLKWQGFQQEVMKFQDKVFSTFQDILKSQNAENHYILCTTNQS